MEEEWIEGICKCAPRIRATRIYAPRLDTLHGSAPRGEGDTRPLPRLRRGVGVTCAGCLIACGVRYKTEQAVGIRGGLGTKQHNSSSVFSHPLMHSLLGSAPFPPRFRHIVSFKPDVVITEKGLSVRGETEEFSSE